LNATTDAPPLGAYAVRVFREINAITLVCTDMAASVRFYSSLGLAITYGGPDSPFTTLAFGSGHVNLQCTGDSPGTGWGRVVLFVDDPDEIHRRAVVAGYTPLGYPTDATWGERYFHIHDPDGHELSFARPLAP
jgi:catechol 2,3-dioxygenase-like lactoylglutathione lyase family enzyme